LFTQTFRANAAQPRAFDPTHNASRPGFKSVGRWFLRFTTFTAFFIEIPEELKFVIEFPFDVE